MGEDALQEIAKCVVRIEQKLDDHIERPEIHTAPPCEQYKTLSARLWGVAVLAVGSLLAALWK